SRSWTKPGRRFSAARVRTVCFWMFRNRQTSSLHLKITCIVPPSSTAISVPAPWLSYSLQKWQIFHENHRGTENTESCLCALCVSVVFDLSLPPNLSSALHQLKKLTPVSVLIRSHPIFGNAQHGIDSGRPLIGRVAQNHPELRDGSGEPKIHAGFR